jgi:hypothetical protein
MMCYYLNVQFKGQRVKGISNEENVCLYDYIVKSTLNEINLLIV